MSQLFDSAAGAASTGGVSATTLPVRSPAWVRARLIAGDEIALLDLREEDPHAQAHPLFAANLPFARIELDAWTRLPNRAVPIVLFDSGAGLVARAAATLRRLGYTDVAALDGDLDGWRTAGHELFSDVNAPSKAFGELVESTLHTPSLAAEEVLALIDARADVVIVDARRFDEFSTMSIPTATSVPGAELVARVRTLAPDPATRVIVNCAGRTRSIIGTQSLINAGLPNPVAALRNGTIGWTLAGQQLDHGQQRRAPLDIAPAAGDGGDSVNAGAAGLAAHAITHAIAPEARSAARAVADRAGVQRARLADLERWLADELLRTDLWLRQHPRDTGCAACTGLGCRCRHLRDGQRAPQPRSAVDPRRPARREAAHCRYLLPREAADARDRRDCRHPVSGGPGKGGSRAASCGTLSIEGRDDFRDARRNMPAARPDRTAAAATLPKRNATRASH